MGGISLSEFCISFFFEMCEPGGYFPVDLGSTKALPCSIRFAFFKRFYNTQNVCQLPALFTVMIGRNKQAGNHKGK